MTVLVTGSKGMIGSRLVLGLLDAGYQVIGVDRVGDEMYSKKLIQLTIDLADMDSLQMIIKKYNVDRIIHLAAIAHTNKGVKISWEEYKHMNYDCSKNVFSVAGNRPVLFISTVDVYGFYDGRAPVTATTPIHPVSLYGKSKAMAEMECKKLSHFSIFRFSPIYSDDIKRDIQKRYYLRYPKIAYRIGSGAAFEILNIKDAVAVMVKWCSEDSDNRIRIIKDEKVMWTPDYIKAEKTKGNATIVVWIPRWIVCTIYLLLIVIFGKNEKTFLLNKAVHPLRTV